MNEVYARYTETEGCCKLVSYTNSAQLIGNFPLIIRGKISSCLRIPIPYIYIYAVLSCGNRVQIFGLTYDIITQNEYNIIFRLYFSFTKQDSAIYSFDILEDLIYRE